MTNSEARKRIAAKAEATKVSRSILNDPELDKVSDLLASYSQGEVALFEVVKDIEEIVQNHLGGYSEWLDGVCALVRGPEATDDDRTHDELVHDYMTELRERGI